MLYHCHNSDLMDNYWGEFLLAFDGKYFVTSSVVCLKKKPKDNLKTPKRKLLSLWKSPKDFWFVICFQILIRMTCRFKYHNNCFQYTKSCYLSNAKSVKNDLDFLLTWNATKNTSTRTNEIIVASFVQRSSSPSIIWEDTRKVFKRTKGSTG